MSIDTLKGLNLIENLAAPVPTAVNSYIRANVATGSGDFGVPTVTDIIGIASGAVATNALNQATSALNSITLLNLKAVYDNMKACVQGTFGPVGGPIVIPSGPAAGTYADADTAFTTGLIPAANAEIVALIATYPVQTTVMNENFNAVCQRIVSEANFQNAAGINYDAEAAGSPSAVYSLVSTLAQVGNYNTPSGQYDYMLKIANTSTQAGQAVVGAIREGKNQSTLNEAGIPVGGFSVSNDWPGLPSSTGTPILQTSVLPPPSAVSDLGQPSVTLPLPKYQTTSNPFSVSYTVAEARQLVESQQLNPLVPPTSTSTSLSAPAVVRIAQVYEQQASTQQPGNVSTTLIQNSSFWINAVVQPSDANTRVTLSTSAGSYVTLPGIDLNNGNGVQIQVPGWLIPNLGVVLLTMTASQPGGPTRSDSINLEIVATNYPKTATVTQDGWFNSVNETVYGTPVTVTFRGPPSTEFTWSTSWTSTWPTGSGTFDANGYRVYSSLVSPPISDSNKLSVRYASGEVVSTTFKTIPI
jgi:hypothetical protein